MSVHFISGKPGGGKSYWALRDYVIPELVNGKRAIVTNLDLNLPALAQYLHDEHGETFDMRERIRVLGADEVSQFWRYWNQGEPLSGEVRVRMPNGKEMRHIDYAPRQAVPGGVLYVIDEVHEFFNSRHWQHTGDDALHYLSQHRKLGDTVACLTQAIGNVDKQFRSIAQDYTYLRNHGKENLPILGGLFKGVQAFMKTVYLEPFTGSQSAVGTKVFKMDMRVAACYHTAGGVGIKGGAADMGRDERKGFPMPVLIGICVAALVVVWWLMTHGGQALLRRVMPQGKASVVAVVAPKEAKEESSRPVGVESNKGVGGPGVLPGKTNDVPAVFVTGKLVLDGRTTVFLSDGRVLSSERHRVRWVDQGVKVDSETYRWSMTAGPANRPARAGWPEPAL